MQQELYWRVDDYMYTLKGALPREYVEVLELYFDAMKKYEQAAKKYKKAQDADFQALSALNAMPLGDPEIDIIFDQYKQTQQKCAEMEKMVIQTGGAVIEAGKKCDALIDIAQPIRVKKCFDLE